MKAVLLAVLLTGSVTAELPWYGHYDQAVQLIDEGRPAEARQHLVAAVAERSEPGRMVRTYGLRYVDYLPYLYLAVASHMMGEVEEARRYLELAERWGVASETAVGAALLPAYRLLLAGNSDVEVAPGAGGGLGGAVAAEAGAAAAGAAATTDDPPGYRVYVEQPRVLPDEEAERVRHEVSFRCGLDPGAQGGRLPWYFHYELGLAFARQGDPQRALDELVAASDRRPESQHGVRMYGMWFTDYLPYYAIARAHAELGNWRCVRSALEVSAQMGELDERDDEFAAFRALLAEAEQRSP